MGESREGSRPRTRWRPPCLTCPPPPPFWPPWPPRRLCNKIAVALGFNLDNGRLDVSVHPFTGGA